MRAPIAGLMQNVSDLPGSAGLEQLKHAAAHNDPAAAKVTASKFESLLAEQMVKSMRQTSMGDALFPGSSQMYRELYDREIAKRLTQGKGLGLQPMIRKALGDKSATPSNAASGLSLASYTRTLAPQHLLPSAPSARELPPLSVTAPTAASAGTPASVPARRLPGITGTGLKLSSSGSERDAKPSDPTTHAPTSRGAPNRPFSAEEFVNAVWPHAQRAAAELGVTPQVLIAQAALESGWGKHVGGDNNLFGIKAGASWHGATRTLNTSEYSGGALRTESASFRSYASVADSFDDYARMLKNNPRYAAALGAGPDNARFAHALQQAGYATDPHYAAKITAIANGPAFAAVLKNPADGPLIASR